MNTAQKLDLAARTDSTFERRGGDWVGKCLICNGPIAFVAATGEGATLEHIRARTRGGTDDPSNLAAVHGRCNWEKGRRWDPKKRRSAGDYEEFVARLLIKRAERFRPVVTRPGPLPEPDPTDDPSNSSGSRRRRG